MENWKKSRLILMMSVTGLAASGQGRTPTANRMRMVMGTLLQVEISADSREHAEMAVEAAFLEVQKMDDILSNYREDSEISRANRAAYPNGVSVSKPMSEFLTLSRGYSELTHGAFDISVEPLTRLWRLRERKLDRMPEDAEVKEALAKVGWKNLELSHHGHTLRFLAEGVGIDTGGIGKGFALDKALQIVRTYPIKSASFNFGGETLYWSEKPQTKIVSVRNPLKTNRAWKTLFLPATASTMAVSTSGNYERFVTFSSATLGHLINPFTGRPAEGPVQSVTVVTASAAEADALSTALFVMGLEQGKTFADGLENAGALFLYTDETGKLKSLQSKNWNRFVKP